MRRLAQLVKGIAALVVLAALVVGVPWALWHFVGWPLPHHVPTATQVGRALNRQGIPAQTLLDALAVVVWLTWAVLVASLAVEIPAALSGHHARRLAVAGIFQPVTGHLIAAVVVACLTLAPRPAHTATIGRWPAAATARRPIAALVVNDAVFTSATQPVPTAAAAASVPASPLATTSAPAPAPTTYVVRRGDTLWGIAERELGDPLRWSEIYQLNEGRPQPGGAALTDPHWIDPGWTLLLPAPSTRSAPTPPAGSTPPTAAPAPAPSAPAPTTPGPPVTTPTTTVPPAPAQPVPAPAHHISSPRTEHAPE
ncbi:MAG: LysM peptidoglycan-binding domain-containing protein, partial [Acidimicrobiales bacterium]